MKGIKEELTAGEVGICSFVGSRQSCLGIPVTSNLGLDSVISRHFGRAPFVLLFSPDPDPKPLGVLPGGSGGGTDNCVSLWAPLLAAGVRTVICQNMGRGAAERFGQAGVEIRICKPGNVRQALNDWRTGLLPQAQLELLCHGHH